MNKFFKTICYILLATNFLTFGFLGFYFYFNTQQTEALISENQQQVSSLSSLAQMQRNQKDEIASLWEQQAALNDDLISAQNDLIRANQEYLAYVDSSLRFVNGEPQLNPNTQEATFLENKNKLIQRVAEVEGIAKEKAETKEKNAERIRQLYLEAGEDMDNTANDRDGLR